MLNKNARAIYQGNKGGPLIQLIKIRVGYDKPSGSPTYKESLIFFKI